MEILWKSPRLKFVSDAPSRAEISKWEADLFNSLLNTVLSAKPNDLIVYYRGPYYRGLGGECPASLRLAASTIYGKGFGALVSRPNGPALDVNRSWNYMLQRR